MSYNLLNISYYRYSYELFLQNQPSLTLQPALFNLIIISTKTIITFYMKLKQPYFIGFNHIDASLYIFQNIFNPSIYTNIVFNITIFNFLLWISILLYIYMNHKLLKASFLIYILNLTLYATIIALQLKNQQLSPFTLKSSLSSTISLVSQCSSKNYPDQRFSNHSQQLLATSILLALITFLPILQLITIGISIKKQSNSFKDKTLQNQSLGIIKSIIMLISIIIFIGKIGYLVLVVSFYFLFPRVYCETDSFDMRGYANDFFWNIILGFVGVATQIFIILFIIWIEDERMMIEQRKQQQVTIDKMITQKQQKKEIFLKDPNLSKISNPLNRIYRKKRATQLVIEGNEQINDKMIWYDGDMKQDVRKQKQRNESNMQMNLKNSNDEVRNKEKVAIRQ